jgi:ABC-type nitrate/sulfonate/bicarbonate transport system substrate-binding protein
MRHMRQTARVLSIAVMGLIAMVGAEAWAQVARPPAIPEIPKQVVRYAHAPFLDHTQAVIGMQKGWFDDVGIDIQPKPYGLVIPSEQRPAALAAGTVDMVSASVAAMLAVMKQQPNIRFFAAGDIFQGYAILAQPDGGYKTYQDFLKSGDKPDEAMVKAIRQMRGKRWAAQGLAVTQQFVDLVLEKAGMTRNDLTIIPVDDPKTVNLMLTRQADFQTAGAPARMELQGKGMIPILTILDMAQNARASADSKELRAVYMDGWVTTSEFWDKHRDTVLRMASVQFRITKFINSNQREALEIHVPFLNSVAGRNLTLEDGRRIYEELDPFLTFEQQHRLYFDKTYPLYYEWEVGAKISAYEERGVYKSGEMTVDKATLAHTVYFTLLDLKTKTDRLMPEVLGAIDTAKRRGKNPARAMELQQRAQLFYDAYSFLDAYRFAVAAKEWAEYAMTQ